MARTIRNIPVVCRNGRAHPHYYRKPHHRWKLLVGMSTKSKHYADDWDDKPVAALSEVKHHLHD